ncbi:ATP-binding protein [Cellulomonas sp. 179-A 4D5 NHS]|uniref:ATP-binding protein n=1 Tax=Cellulomonas sp. 179-A 4D5 NHS TaxID=3142378 RepID=UPI0039A018EF
MHVPALLSSARLGRQWSVRLARSYGASEPTLHVVELLTSEVVTNAVKYGRVRDAIDLDMACTPQELTVSVTDGNPCPPVVLDVDMERTGGQGMRVVERLARSWGWLPTRDGKRVWFTVPLA